MTNLAHWLAESPHDDRDAGSLMRGLVARLREEHVPIWRASYANYGVSGAAITGCGIGAVGTWGYNLSTLGDNAMGVAKYRR